jgi:signal transduction histidine kinase
MSPVLGRPGACAYAIGADVRRFVGHVQRGVERHGNLMNAKDTQLLQSTIDALPAYLAVLSNVGDVLLINSGWRAFFSTTTGIGAGCQVGDNYLVTCEQSDGRPDAVAMVRGIRSVAAGTASLFKLEYPCDCADPRLWFAVTVTRFVVDDTVRLVVAHENVTSHRRAQEELQHQAEQHQLQQRALTARFLGTLEEERRSQRLLTHRIITALEEERRAISFELHDGLTQYVMSSFAFFDSYASDILQAEIPLAEDLQKGLKYLQDAVVEARRLVNGLRSLALDELGLVGALEQLLNEERERTLWDDAPLFVPSPIPRFDPMLETAVYRVVQEALSNIRKHAATRRVAVTLTMIQSNDDSKRLLQIEVRDWGKGFAVSERRTKYDHIGLNSMAERVYLLQGNIRIESQPGEGTRVIAEIPIDGTHERV